MLSKLDESVGKIVTALRDTDMLKNSVIVFTTDNGGPAAGFNLNAASNSPLRGVKNTLWEGGVRGAALVWSPLIQESSRVAVQRMHIVDWLPTLLNVASGSERWAFEMDKKLFIIVFASSVLEDIDGIDMWNALSSNLDSNRTEILHNIDDIFGNSAITVGPWKLIHGTTTN